MNWWQRITGKLKPETRQDPVGSERRTMLRKPVNHKTLETDAIPNVHLLDISVGGVCFIADSHMESGSTVTLGGDDFRVRATVLDSRKEWDPENKKDVFRVRCQFLGEQDRAQVVSLLIQVLDEESNEIFV